MADGNGQRRDAPGGAGMTDKAGGGAGMTDKAGGGAGNKGREGAGVADAGTGTGRAGNKYRAGADGAGAGASGGAGATGHAAGSSGTAGKSGVSGMTETGGATGHAAGSSGTGRNVARVMALSLAARALALVGSMLYTRMYGFGAELDAYAYAVNLPNLVFNCLGTAIMTVVVPIFAGRLASGEQKEAYRFADAALTLSIGLSLVMAAGGVALAPLIADAVGGFGGSPLATFALRLMFPVMLFYALSYVLQGVLQSHGRYIAPAAAAACSGASVVLYVVFLGERHGVRGLLAATFIGLAGQALFLLPSARSARKERGAPFRPRLGFSNPDVRAAGRLTLPVLVASSSYQVNMVVNSTFATAFVGGVVTVSNTQNLALVAAQLFILSTLAVYFPKMSERHAVGDAEGYSLAFAGVLRLIAYFALPASCALAYLSRYLMPLMYGRGLVTEGDVRRLCAAFSLYAGSIAFIGLKEAVDRAFYAARDSRTPAAVGAFIMAMNVGLGYALMKPLGLIGLPAAYIASMAAGSMALFAAATLRRVSPKHGGAAQGCRNGSARRSSSARISGSHRIDGASAGSKQPARELPGAPRVALPKGTLSLILKCCIGCAAMAAAMAMADAALGALLPVAAPAAPVAGSKGTLQLAARLAALCAVGGAAYLAATLAMRVEEASAIASSVSAAIRVRAKR